VQHITAAYMSQCQAGLYTVLNYTAEDSMQRLGKAGILVSCRCWLLLRHHGSEHGVGGVFQSLLDRQRIGLCTADRINAIFSCSVHTVVVQHVVVTANNQTIGKGHISTPVAPKLLIGF